MFKVKELCPYTSVRPEPKHRHRQILSVAGGNARRHLRPGTHSPRASTTTILGSEPRRAESSSPCKNLLLDEYGGLFIMANTGKPSRHPSVGEWGPFCGTSGEGPSAQFRSVAQSCPTLCDPMDCGTPGLPVHHRLLEFTQTHIHRVGDAIQPSHPVLSDGVSFSSKDKSTHKP